MLICGASPLACRAVPLPERPYRRYRWLIARLPVPHEHARTGDTTGSSVPKHLPRARAGPLARVVARAPTPVPAHDTRARKHVPISTGNRARNWRAPTRNSLHFRYRILFTTRRDGEHQKENTEGAGVSDLIMTILTTTAIVRISESGTCARTSLRCPRRSINVSITTKAAIIGRATVGSSWR